MRLISYFLALVLSASLIFLLRGSPASPRCRHRGGGSGSKLKHSSVVQDDDLVAGLGISGRIQCRSSSGKPAATWISSSCGTQSVGLVSLFVPPDRHSGECDGSVVGGRVLRGLEKGYSVLRVFVESARLAMPNSQQLVLTDPAAAISTERLPAGISFQRVPGNYSRGNLMLQRLDSYIAFLDDQIKQVGKADSLQHFIFADSDMIVVGDLGCVFLEFPSFDVALTFRNNKEQPINSGMIFVRGSKDGLAKGKLLLQSVVDSYRRDFFRASRMMGDQLAFAWVVRHFADPLEDSFKQGKVFKSQVKGVEVLFLPCSSYNWTPAEGAGQFHGMPLDVKAIHFKGSRKRLMLEAWDSHKHQVAATKDLLPLQCFVLKSGRSKYDF
ncbi:uncharacterized protein LOC9631181 [Selaginella moellendorffii]|nr:uncharacterized protein LOC9631181 [Selaginella moellendorffii]XP_024529164.1 uncharacterized protein LOC9631181 [Selaginella moellendorffii]|eukprot:XP_002968395.2 uncharacterized protein LOC9631181 [Selaginella moellendorffii]